MVSNWSPFRRGFRKISEGRPPTKAEDGPDVLERRQSVANDHHPNGGVAVLSWLFSVVWPLSMHSQGLRGQRDGSVIADGELIVRPKYEASGMFRILPLILAWYLGREAKASPRARLHVRNKR